MRAGFPALTAPGYLEHEAVFAAHGDKAHTHQHIVASRIHPVTRKTHNPKDDQKILQAWGHAYDKARGTERCNCAGRCAFRTSLPASPSRT
jgi:Relaxase/Mobilisation nuclease domain